MFKENAGGTSAGTDSVNSEAGSAGTGGAGGAGAAPGDGYFWRTTNACPTDRAEVLECGETGEGCASEGKPGTEHRVDSDPGESERAFYIGLSRMRLGSVNDDTGLTANEFAWETIGFDLDGVCTNSSTCSLTKGDDLASSDPCRAPGISIPYDGDNCRDNLVGQLFKIAALSPEMVRLGFTEQAWNCAINAGWMNLIFKVSDYNGEANDDSVRVDVYSSIGIPTPAYRCDQGPDYSVQPGWWNEAPWTASDPWKVSRRSIAPGADDLGDDLPDAVVADADAYVRDNWLVAELPDGSNLWLNGERAQTPGIRFLLHRGLLTAKLDKDPQTGEWSANEGTIAGAMLSSDIVTAFREIGFCENFCNAYSTLSSYVATFGDILASTKELLPDEDCDAMSLGMAFRGRQVTARAADIVDADPPKECPDPKNPEQPRQGCTCSSDGTTCE